MSMEQNARSSPLIIPAVSRVSKLRGGAVAVIVSAIGLVVAALGFGYSPEKSPANPGVERTRVENTRVENTRAGLSHSHTLTLSDSPQPARIEPASPAWNGGFSSGQLNPGIWALNAEGDFSERVVDVINARNSAPPDYSLRLRAATMNTRDDTVKSFGAHSLQSFPLNNATITADLDWNDQANGCYMSAGLILAPEAVSGNPLNGDNWLKVEYIGVPPGKNARIEISVKQDGRPRTLFNEGWPEKNRAGRPIAVQHLEINTRRGSVSVLENGAPIFESKTRELSFEAGHLYLQMSSHSNYPPREIYFRGLTLSFER
jgi:hypothetical protein